MPATETPMQALATHSATSLLPGFDNPVDDAQAVFRAALEAFAHPGRLETLPATSGQPEGLSPALTALLLTLADPDTPVWLPADVPAAARAFLRFHCSCPLVDEIGAATFVCVRSARSKSTRSELMRGGVASLQARLDLASREQTDRCCGADYGCASPAGTSSAPLS